MDKMEGKMVCSNLRTRCHFPWRMIFPCYWIQRAELKLNAAILSQRSSSLVISSLNERICHATCYFQIKTYLLSALAFLP